MTQGNIEKQSNRCDKPAYSQTNQRSNYRNYPMFSDTLCFRTPPIFYRNNYVLDAQKHVFRTPLFSDTAIFHRNYF